MTHPLKSEKQDLLHCSSGKSRKVGQRKRHGRHGSCFPLWKYYEKCERTPLPKRLKKVTIIRYYKAASDIWTSADLLAIADRSEKLSDLASKSHPWRDEDR